LWPFWGYTPALYLYPGRYAALYGQHLRALLDRIDNHIDVPAVHYRELSATSDGEPSAQICQRAQEARRMQDQRFAQITHVFCHDHHADQNNLHPE
jgi:predicted ATPase with chaperone activity